ncbi:MAG: GNAT family N-acetyltransferase [Nonomuraea sp.]|nr:GNAT family N-acetyltransferase [Nonomuraea sp.]
MSVRWGPLTGDDVGALDAFWHAVEAADRTDERLSAADQFATPGLDLATGTLAAWDGDAIVAAALMPSRPEVQRLWGAVHPGHRRQGYGTRLLTWATGAAVARMLEVNLYVDIPGTAELAEGAGLTRSRLFADMGRDLAAELPPVTVPAGVEFVTWTPALDEGAMEVRNAAFRDHWGSVPHTRESWRHFQVGAGFVPSLSFLALAGGRPVSLVITHDRGATAWIHIVGTLREWRGKGVAGGLLAHALAAFRAAGYGTAGLAVDATNPTGAVRVYERAGFVVTREHAAYTREFRPA